MMTPGDRHRTNRESRSFSPFVIRGSHLDSQSKGKEKKRINYTRYVHTTEITRGKWNVLSLKYIFIFLIATKNHIK